MTELPRIRNYGNYSNSNYGAHCLEVTIGGLSVYFSYDTPIAFAGRGNSLTISENCWGATTGKHLNCIDRDKKKRLARAEFEKRLAVVKICN